MHRQAQHAIARAQDRAENRAALQHLFDTYLNALTADLRQRAEHYAKQRRVLKDVIAPYNFETAAYAQENYTLFSTHIAPSLRQSADDIINLFGQYKAKLHHDLHDAESETAHIFAIKWQDMTTQQLSHYVDFFMQEDRRLRAYDDLLTFYVTHHNAYTIDAQHNTITFNDPKDHTTESRLKARLN